MVAVRRACLVVALLLAGCGAAPEEPPPPRIVTIVQDDAELLHRPLPRIAATLDELRDLGADWVRVTAGWDVIEPARGTLNWTALDLVHGLARRRGLRLNIDIAFFKPDWADWSDYAGFAARVARRYPDAAAFTVWNEPNLATFMRPQERAPEIYRAMVRTAVPRIRRGAPDALVLIGGTQPFATSANRTGPLEFLRALTCAEPGPGCGGYTPLPGDGWAHHPYSGPLAPWEHHPDPGGARMGDLGRLVAELDRLRDRFENELPLYLTEYGHQTDPPDPTWDVTPAEQARYLGENERIARSHPEVRAVSQFLVRDLGPRPGGTPQERWRDFQTGLRFADGRPKPALAAFALPLTAHRAGPGRVALWGLVRPGEGRRRATVTADGRVVAELETQPDGTFSTTVGTDPGATFQLHALGRRGAALHGAR